MFLEKSTKDQNGVHRHLLVSHAQVTLSLHGELGESYSKATRKIVIFSVHQSVSQRKVGALILGLSSSLSSRSLIFKNDGLSTITSVRKDNSLSDNLGASFFDFFLFCIFNLKVIRRLSVDWKRSNISLNRFEGLDDLVLTLSIFSDDPECNSDDQMRANLRERLANVCENGSSVLWVHFDDLSDEQDSFQRGEGRFAFKLEERLHEGTKYKRNRLREGLRDLVDRFD